MTLAFIEAVDVTGPGFTDWNASLGILRDPSTYVARDVSAEANLLHANERRRTTPVIRLALQAIEQVTRRSSVDLSKARSVFASSLGDLHVLDGVCAALAKPGAPVSPAQFHNIVHNAPAGYWSIGTHAKAGSTSLSARDATFAAGLIEVCTYLRTGDGPVLFVCYDQPAPATLAPHLPVVGPFAVAMVLTPEPSEEFCCSLRIELVPQTTESRLQHPELEQLRLGNTAARALPLLHAIASGSAERVFLSYLGPSSLAIDVVPPVQIPGRTVSATLDQEPAEVEQAPLESDADVVAAG